MALFYEDYVSTWLDLTMASALPFTIIFICNIAMVMRLKTANKTRQQMQGNLQTKDIDITSITVMLLTVSFIFLITSLPICIFLIMDDSLYPMAVESEDYHQISYLEAGFAIVSLIWYMNYAINFFVYVLRVPRFRRELCAMFRCKYWYHEEEQASVTIATVISLDQTRL